MVEPRNNTNRFNRPNFDRKRRADEKLEKLPQKTVKQENVNFFFDGNASDSEDETQKYKNQRRF